MSNHSLKALQSDLEYIYERTRNLSFENGTVVITGCAGFIGYTLLHVLCSYAESYKIKKVIGLDSFLLGHPNWIDELQNEYPHLFSCYTFVLGKDTFADSSLLSSATHILHMASIASPTYYRKYPIETIEGNVWGLKDLLDNTIKSNMLRSFAFMSSSEIYGDPEPTFIPTPESYRGRVSCTGPRACYDESKRFGETICTIYSNEYQRPISMIRPFNNYGPGLSLNDRRLPADFANAVVSNKDIILYSDGTPTRTFCYIADAIVGYISVIASCYSGPINIGSDTDETSVFDMAKIYQSQARQLFAYSGEVKFDKSPDSNYLTDNPTRRVPDISLARQKLGYTPSISNVEGVRRYLKFLSNPSTDS